MKEKKAKINQGVCYSRQDFSDLTGTIIHEHKNNMYLITLDPESIDKLDNNYVEYCEHEGLYFDRICLRKDKEFIIIDE